MGTDEALGVTGGGHDGWGLWGAGPRRQGGHDGMGTALPAQFAADRKGRVWRSEAPGANGKPCHAGGGCSAGSGQLQCLVPGCGGLLAPGGSGWNGSWSAGRVDGAGAAAAGGLQGVRHVAGAAAGYDAATQAVLGGGDLDGAAGGGGDAVEAGRGAAGVPFKTVRGWLRRFTRRADRVQAWLWGCWPGWWMIRRCRRGPRPRPGRWRCWRRCISRCPAGGRWWPPCRRGSWLPGCHGAACFPRPGRRGRSTRVHR